MLVDAPNYDHNDTAVSESLSESVNWLKQNGFIRQAPTQSTGIYCLTEKGLAYADSEEAEPPSHEDIRHLHGLIHEQVKEKYLSGCGSYRAAVTDAYVLILDRVKKLSGQPNASGQDVRYLRRIFLTAPPNGLLTPSDTTQKMRPELFAGAFGKHRNKPSHSFVGSEDKDTCLDALCSASVLMKELDLVETELLPF